MVKNTIVQKEMARLDAVIGRKYLGNGSPIPKEFMCNAYIWLQQDIADALTNSEDMEATLSKITELINTSKYSRQVLLCISLEKAEKEAKIRRDWSTALAAVKHGWELSDLVSQCFSEKDIASLAKLHKANQHRRKIAELLSYCNLHYECSKFAAGEYEEFLDLKD